MAEMFYDADADLSVIQGRNVAVLGYGSQGHAHALSLRDSGVDVRVGLAEGSRSRAKAEAQGLRVVDPATAVEESDVIMVLVPDHVQRHLYKEAIEPNIAEGDALFFGHGFNIRFGYIKPPAGVDVCMVAPEGSRPPGAPRVRGRPRRARARRRRGGRHGQGLAARAVVREGHRRAARRRHQDDVHRGDRDRPLRRAGRALRRHVAAGPGRLRGAHRGRLPARGRLLRVPARAEAHRRPDVRGRHRQAALVASPTPPSTATTSPARGSSTTPSSSGCRTCSPTSRTAPSPPGSSPTRTPARRSSSALRAEGEQHPIEATGRELRGLMSWVKGGDSDYVEGTAAR